MNKNKRKKAIDTLEKAVELAAKKINAAALVDEILQQSGTCSLIRRTTGLYSVVSGKILYSDIFLYDSALMIYGRVIKKKYFDIPALLELDTQFAKHKEDLKFYKHNASFALDKKDVERYLVLEDRILVAMDAMERLRRKIQSKKISV
jgi:hypothetical protein